MCQGHAPMKTRNTIHTHSSLLKGKECSGPSGVGGKPLAEELAPGPVVPSDLPRLGGLNLPSALTCSPVAGKGGGPTATEGWGEKICSVSQTVGSGWCPGCCGGDRRWNLLAPLGQCLYSPWVDSVSLSSLRVLLLLAFNKWETLSRLFGS